MEKQSPDGSIKFLGMLVKYKFLKEINKAPAGQIQMDETDEDIDLEILEK